jgi:hypothetical protein
LTCGFTQIQQPLLQSIPRANGKRESKSTSGMKKAIPKFKNEEFEFWSAKCAGTEHYER